MLEETRIALLNYEWLVKNSDAEIDWETDTVIAGDGGFDISELARPGITPAT